jgi:pimeloyl-ACP methyl ester carboxylesterase
MPGRNIYALDLPGHGKSGGEGRQSVPDYAADVMNFVESVGIYRVVLAGHSLGGMVAMQAALQKPDQVAGLVLVSSSSECPIPHEIVQDLLHPITFKQSLDWLVSRLTSSGGDKKWVDATRQAVEQTRRGVLYGDLVACRSVDLSSSLNKIMAPTLVCVGDQDKFFTPGASRKLARNIPNARLECIPGAGHLLSLEKPDELDRLITAFMDSFTK